MRLFRDPTAKTAKVGAILSSLEAELDAALSPSNRAMQSLGVNRYGWCRDVHSSDAEKIWAQQLSAHPDDSETLHHLAILHHGRAFDLEASEDPTASDADWAKSAAYWKRLLSDDSFWKKLEGVLPEEHASSIQAARSSLPLQLLKIHFEIGYSILTPAHRAKYHVQQAKATGLPLNLLEVARAKTYERQIADLPDEVWGGDGVDIDILEGACTKILRILDIDPDCLVALEDGLRLQRRLVSLLRFSLEELEDEEKKLALQERIASQKKWAPYFERFSKARINLTDEVRDDLLIWLTCVGDAAMALERFKDAVSIFDSAITIALPEDSTRKFLVRKLCVAHSLFAREISGSDNKRGFAECERVLRERAPLSSFAWSLIAEGFAHAQAFGRALETCREGLSLTPDTSNEETIISAEHEAGRVRLKKLQVVLQDTLEQLVNGIWEQISESLKPLGPNIDKCKASLREIALAEKEYTAQRVYDQFMTRLQKAPKDYCDLSALKIRSDFSDIGYCYSRASNK